MNTQSTELSLAGNELVTKDLVRTAMTGPLACRTAPTVGVGEAAPALREFERQEAARMEREAEERRQRERRATRIPAD